MLLMNKIWTTLYSQSGIFCTGYKWVFSSTFPVSAVCNCNFVVLFCGDSCGHHHTPGSAYYLNFVHVVTSHLIIYQQSVDCNFYTYVVPFVYVAADFILHNFGTV